MREMELHGVRISVPDDWRDVSVHRFLAPRSAPPGTPMPVAKKPVELQPNLVVTREELGAGNAGSKEFLASTARSRSDRNPSFRVLAEGGVLYRGQPCHWLDAAEDHQGLVVHQRYIAFAAKDAITLATLTGTQDQVRDLSKRLGFEIAGA